MPQGITNAPSTFQRLMKRCIGDLNCKVAPAFTDDLIVFSDTLEEHESKLLQVLNWLKEYELKLSKEKCKFLQTSVRYLEWRQTQRKLRHKTWLIPKNLKNCGLSWVFPGIINALCKTIPRSSNLWTISLQGTLPSGNTAVKSKRRLTIISTRWTPECHRAFDEIISELTPAPVLGFANHKLLYTLHTDTSTTGLGEILYQQQDGQMRAISFASRGLTKRKANYSAHKLEYLALKWAVTIKFSDYLYETDFTVLTDSNLLTFILTCAKLDATSYRWLSGLSAYSFKIQYTAGTQN